MGGGCLNQQGPPHLGSNLDAVSARVFVDAAASDALGDARGGEVLRRTVEGAELARTARIQHELENLIVTCGCGCVVIVIAA